MPGVKDVTEHGLDYDSLRVYVAGPYTHGVWEHNIREVIHAGQKIYDAGHYPFLPHLHTFPWALHYDNEWIEMGLVWVEVCDALVRLSGKSSGADSEVEFAEHKGIPVYYGVNEFLEAKS